MPNDVCESQKTPLALLQYQVEELRRDFYSHANTVNEHIETVVKYMTSEIAIKQEREKTEEKKVAKSDLTFTKIMAIAAVIGAIQSLPTYFHLFHP